MVCDILCHRRTVFPQFLNDTQQATLSALCHGTDKGDSRKIEVPDGVDAELLMKVLVNPEMAALLTSLAKTMK